MNKVILLTLISSLLSVAGNCAFFKLQIPRIERSTPIIAGKFIKQAEAYSLAKQQFARWISRNEQLPNEIAQKCTIEHLLDSVSALFEPHNQPQLQADVMNHIWDTLEFMVLKAQQFRIPRDVLFACDMLKKRQAQQLARYEFNRWITARSELTDRQKQSLTLRPLLETVDKYFMHSTKADRGCLTLHLWDTIEQMVNDLLAAE